MKKPLTHGPDFAASPGTPVWAALDGRVSYVGRKGPNGNLVILEHDKGARTYYAHLSQYARGLKPGAAIRQGQVIGFVGSTGRSTGPHLHFALKIDGRFVDPLKYRVLPGRMLPARYLGPFRTEAERLRRVLAKTEIKRPKTLPAELEGGESLTSGEDLDQ